LDGKHLYYVNWECSQHRGDKCCCSWKYSATHPVKIFWQGFLMSISHKENLLFQCRGVAFRYVIRMHDTENIRVFSFSFLWM
jgi:hypothetical protein